LKFGLIVTIFAVRAGPHMLPLNLLSPVYGTHFGRVTSVMVGGKHYSGRCWNGNTIDLVPLIICAVYTHERRSAVVVATGYVLNERGVEVRVPVG
jgi:hypothetical protein